MSTEQNSQATNLVICDHFDEQKCAPQCCHSKPHVPVLTGCGDIFGNGPFACDNGLEVCGWRHDAPTCICVPCEQKEAK